MTERPASDTGEWREVTVAADDIDSHLVAGRLEEAGIPVLLSRDASGYGDYLFGGSNPHAPVRILVPEERAEEASDIVRAASAEVASGGDDGDVPTLAAGSGFPWRWAIAVLLLGLILLALFVNSPVIRDIAEL